MIPSKPISTMILNIIQNDIVTTASKSTASELIDHAWIRLQIQNILNEMPGLYATDEQIEIIIRGVSDRVDVVVHEAEVIVDHTKKRVPWYTPERLAKTERIFWDSFESYIRSKNDIPDSVIRQTNLDTDKTLKQLCDPLLTEPFLCRGMVVGDVQAGKTLNYSALINKACDMGYKLIIVLTGLTEDLRSQTQRRLDRDFVGQESQRSRVGVSATTGNRIGVGIGRGSQPVMVLTDKNTDFKNPGVLNIDGSSNPVLIVAKKNKSILEEINIWLRTQNSGGKKLQSPVLIIDDEADNASVDTAKPDQEPRAINKAIRNMLKLCDRVSYVAYTATPFANIFIAPDDYSDAAEMKDLFPEDFIVALNPPSNYRGGKFFFIDENTAPKATILIKDAEEKIPLKHKSGFTVNELPQSLIDCLATFFVAAAIKDIRRISGKINTSNPDNKFDTCLINVSRLTSAQDSLRHLVQEQVDYFFSAIKANAGLKESRDSKFNYLRELFIREYADDLSGSTDWSDVCKSLLAMDKPEVVVIHGKSDDSMNWDEKSPKKLIAIGGFRLSRGLTLSGLTVSYLYRNSLMYDTLMQMGRWFGYRDGYEDLLRLWCSPQSMDWYSHITNATEELRDSIAQMAKQNMTPNDFGMRVRSHPDLLVTAKNKMQTSKNVAVQMSFSGTYETYSFDLDSSLNEENKVLTLNLIKSNLNKKITAPEDQTQHFFMGDVSGNEIISFLKNLNVHRFNGGWADKELFGRYLDYVYETDLMEWDLCVFNKKHGVAGKDSISEELSEVLGRHVFAQTRTIFFNDEKNNYLKALFVNGNRKLSTGAINRIGLSGDLERSKPMLVIHVIEPLAPLDKKLPDELKDAPGNLYYGISVILPVTKKEIKTISYDVTRGWLARYMPESEDFDDIIEVEEI